MKTNQIKSNQNSFFILFILILFLIFQIFPYIYGYIIVGEDRVFSGFIIHWNDNNTYLAKMNQGFEGNWLFTLDYAREDGEGEFLYTLYLSLGHLARIFKLNLITTFHISRVIASVLMFFSLNRFIRLVFWSEKKRTKNVIFFAALIGTGFSWISIYFSADLTSMLEAFPSNAANITVHFPLTLACLFYILAPYKIDTRRIQDYILYFMLSLLCGLVSSFAVVILVAVLTGILVYRWMVKAPAKEAFWQLIAVGNGGGWIILYQFWTMNTNPHLKLWTAQNIIRPITLFNFFLALTPMIWFAVGGIILYLKQHRIVENNKIVIFVWGIFLPFLLMIPASISPRFLLGGAVPIACLGFVFLLEIFKNKKTFILILSTFYSILIITFEVCILVLLCNKHLNLGEITIFLEKGVYDGYIWIDENLTEDSLILTTHSTGNYIPRYTNSKPTLGHWCETPYAKEQEILAEKFFMGNVSSDYLYNQGINYIFYGPDERLIGDAFSKNDLKIIYDNEDIILYEIIN